ncbi:MAG: DUF1292 domain-containing protein [Clostridia bacterium]|nr:DUF1292 domain-containing protein [Clostridia bacterium]
MGSKELSPIEKIFCSDYYDNIVLYNANDEPVEFEQVAIVSLRGRDFCILRPVILFEGMEENEAIVFEAVRDEDGELRLDVVKSEPIVDKVFDEYYKMLEEAIANDSKYENLEDD